MAGYREFQTGEVLTAGNVNNFLMNQAVMVFANASARTTALAGVLAEGMLTYNLDTQALEVYDGTSFVAVGGAMKEKRIAAFTGSGTWTVPAGVTYAIAHMMGGGGGSGRFTTGGAGGTSSVAFASGTVTGPGMARAQSQAGGTEWTGTAGVNGIGGSASLGHNQTDVALPSPPTNVFVVAGADVTPGASISVTVGAGGSAGTNGFAGGSGYVYIEYYEEV